DTSGTLVFVNGRIHTMDAGNSIVSSVTVKDGRFTAVGNGAHAQGPGVRVINLKGRTVVPGIIESHTHFVSLANRPGYHVAQWELASNIAEVLELLAARRRDVPPGQFITAMGAGTPRSFAELPLPTPPLFTLNHYRMYDAWLALHREGRSFIRLQINFLHNQPFIPALGDLDHQLPELRERLKNQLFFFGDDMVRTGAIGEWAAPFA